MISLYSDLWPKDFLVPNMIFELSQNSETSWEGTLDEPIKFGDEAMQYLGPKNGSDNLPKLLMPLAGVQRSLLAKNRVEIRNHIAKFASKIETGGGNIQPQLRTSQIASDWDEISLELLPGGRAPSVGGTNQNYYWRQRLEKRGCLFERRRRLVYTWCKKNRNFTTQLTQFIWCCRRFWAGHQQYIEDKVVWGFRDPLGGGFSHGHADGG